MKKILLLALTLSLSTAAAFNAQDTDQQNALTKIVGVLAIRSNLYSGASGYCNVIDTRSISYWKSAYVRTYQFKTDGTSVKKIEANINQTATDFKQMMSWNETAWGSNGWRILTLKGINLALVFGVENNARDNIPGKTTSVCVTVLDTSRLDDTEVRL